MDERTIDPPASDASAPQPPVPRTGEDGKPIYDQEFFLALARCGSSQWNQWCDENKNIEITFEGVDFRQTENASIDFSCFVFNNADFRWSIFGTDDISQKNFHDATFERADFSGAAFGNYANFSRAKIGRGIFSGATFGSDANFSFAEFNYGDFRCAAFGDSASFYSATFAISSDFSCSSFGYGGPEFEACSLRRADFFGAIIGGGASFAETKFSGVSLFAGANREDCLQVLAKVSELWPKAQATKFINAREAFYSTTQAMDLFPQISFSGARFHDTAIFAQRRFEGLCDLTGAAFDQPPVFDDCKGLEGVDLYGAKIKLPGKIRFLSGWTTRTDVLLRIRLLRKLAEDTNNHDLERDLYIEERRAERGVILRRYFEEALRFVDGEERSGILAAIVWAPRVLGYSLWILTMATYGLLADYGRSFVRPLIALATSVPLLWWAYSATLIPPRDPTKLADFRRATWAFAISNAVPFVGALTLERDVKLTLLCGDRPINEPQAQATGQPLCVPIPGRRFQLLALGQSIFSALCIFFAGLALRNYFKLR